MNGVTVARVIIRTAMHEGKPGKTQQAIRKHLRDDCGYETAGRATVEGDGNVAEIMQQLRTLLEILEASPGGGVLDHLWIYVDTPDYEGYDGPIEDVPEI